MLPSGDWSRFLQLRGLLRRADLDHIIVAAQLEPSRLDHRRQQFVDGHLFHAERDVLIERNPRLGVKIILPLLQLLGERLRLTNERLHALSQSSEEEPEEVEP